MTNYPMHLLVDIDHTISDADWRNRYYGPRNLEEARTEEGKAQWRKYHELSENDDMILETIDMIRMLTSLGWIAWTFTARPSYARDVTSRWILANCPDLFEGMLFREDDDFRPSPAIKLELIRKNFSHVPKNKIIIMDDRDDVAEELSREGYIVLQVHFFRGDHEYR